MGINANSKHLKKFQSMNIQIAKDVQRRIIHHQAVLLAKNIKFNEQFNISRLDIKYLT